MAWVVLVFLWVLGRTLLHQVHPRFLFGYSPGYRLNGCCLWRRLIMFNLNLITMEETLNEIGQPYKPTLCPKSRASKGLNILYTCGKIFLVYLLVAFGVVTFIVGLFQEAPYLQEFVVGGLLVILSGLINWLFLQFLKATIVMTRAAECYIAVIESKYDVK